MEEKKCKIMELSTQNKEVEKPQKMSYEQLEQVAHQLSEQARQLYVKLQKTEVSNMFKRLDYLFKIVENNSVFDEAFLEDCIREIEDIMTISEDKNTDTYEVNNSKTVD